MADIQTRQDSKGKTKYTARIRVKGYKPQSATFTTLTAAKTWANKQEAAMRDGKHLPAQEAKRRTLALRPGLVQARPARICASL